MGIKMKAKILYVALNIFNALDIITTTYAIHYAIAEEANPIMAFLIKHCGLIVFALFKCMFIVLISYVLIRKKLIKILAFMTVVYLFAVINNLLKITDSL